MSTGSGTRLEVLAPNGLPEVREGDDLAVLASRVVDLHDGDILVVTSKVVSKAEGRVRDGTRDDALAEETARVVARRGGTSIVRTHHGLTLAAAGIDASNVEAGRIVLLPTDPDASARRIRESLAANVGVLVTDTAGRAWRHGQTDLAIGAAGVLVVEDFAGRVDGHGNELAVTLPAVADEIAGAAELAQGKLGGRPLAVLRGRADLVLPRGEHGSGAATLVREEGADLFGYGAREAVLRALAGDPRTRGAFGAPVGADELAELVAPAVGAVRGVAVPGPGDTVSVTFETSRPDAAGALPTACFACGWEVLEGPRADDRTVVARVRPAGP